MSTEARLRSWPLLGDLPAFRADRTGFFTRLARERGDRARFRIGPYEGWLLSHPDDAHDVLVTHAARFRKGPVLQRARLVLGDGLLTAEPDDHRDRRRMLQHAFHPARIDGYATAMRDQASGTASRWRAGQPVDVHAEMVRLTLATAGATLFGADVEQDVPAIERAVDDLLSAYRLAFVPFGWRLERLPVGPPRRLRRGRASLHRLVDRLVAERRADGRDRGDLLSALVLGGEDDGPPLTDRQLRDELVTLLLAGHETTANALAFAFHLLARSPQVERRLHEELEQVLGGRPPEAEDLDRLPLCRAVLSESLRLYPPSWALGREARETHHLGEEAIAAGEPVVVSPWVLHRDPRWWEHPDRFDPDRWHRPTHPRWAYLPFGAGARRCIGEGFAWTEGVTVLATIAQRWRLSPVPGRDLELEALITLRPRGGLPMTPTPHSMFAGSSDG